MQTIEDYKFNVSLSVENFSDKTISNAMIGSVKDNWKNKEIRKEYGYKRGVSFVQSEVTPHLLLDKLIHGHVFCHNFEPRKTDFRKDGTFGATGKCNECFTYSNVIGVDIDGKTCYNTVREFIDCLSLKPTFWHTSFSHMTKGYPKFRMVYVFEERIENPFWFRYCSSKLINILKGDLGMEKDGDEIDKCVDKAGLNCSQYFNGTNIATTEGVEYGISNLIYDLEDIGVGTPFDEDFRYYLIRVCDYSDSQKKKHWSDIKSLLNNITDIEYYYNQKKGIMEDMSCSDDEIIDSIDLVGDFEITDWDTTSFSDTTNTILYFWDRNIENKENFQRMRVWETTRQNTHYLYRVEKRTWEKDLYQVVGDNYFRLPFYYHKRTTGQHRRRTLYYRMCLRRVMAPTINRDEMVVNTLIDIMRFFDNGDYVLNSEFIKRKVDECFKMTVSEIEQKLQPLIEYYQTTTHPVDGMIYKNKRCHTRETKYLILDDYYNATYTDTENLEYMNEVLWFSVSKSLFSEYKAARGFTNTDGRLTDEELYDFIDVNLSVRQNLAMLREQGKKCKNARMSRIHKLKKGNMSKLRA